jgi:hypothetical protein
MKYKFEELEKALKEFDYTACFSDDWGVMNYWEKKAEEIEAMIKDLKKYDKERTQKMIDKYNTNEFGTKFSIHKKGDEE